MDAAPVIRAATLADADEIARVHIASSQTGYRGILPDDYLDRAPEREPACREGWRRDLSAPAPDFAAFVAVDAAGAIGGFASVGRERRAPDGRRGEILAVYTLATQRRGGLGRALVARCAGHLRERGFAGMVVWVLERNLAARRFYESLGGVLVPDSPCDFHVAGTTLIQVSYAWEPLPPPGFEFRRG
jgi:ribosomal protein S18 acetylase RimI-like enzyme